MLRKLVNRVVGMWCLFGVYKLMSFAHPYVIEFWDKRDFFYGEPETPDKVMCWVGTLFITVGVTGALFGLSELAKWFFSEKTKTTNFSSEDIENWNTLNRTVNRVSGELGSLKRELGVTETEQVK